ncbi:MAG: cryptochrome/photolyase family protein [Pseudomonadota bacterium]
MGRFALGLAVVPRGGGQHSPGKRPDASLTMTTALLIFPHQLFAEHPGFDEAVDRVLLVEDTLFFGDPQYPARFHKQKLWLHRASMAHYMDVLRGKGFDPELVSYEEGQWILCKLIADLARDGVDRILVCDPTDFILVKRLRRYADEKGIALDFLPSPLFLNTREETKEWRESQRRWFMAEFYKTQRRKLGVLMDGDDPVGGQWSFDEDNRKKVPKKLQGSVPTFNARTPDDVEEDARRSVNQQFPDNYGNLDNLYWPTDHEGAADWLDGFLKERFELFGPYEDAVLEGESLLWHSAITPMLNIGLLTPQQVMDAVEEHLKTHDVPLNSAEGFVRQVIGWREFMRATYEDLGVRMRTTNHWNHTRSIPESFWTGETGIVPIDDAIKRILDTGYCHHIERLMILGGFMFLCEFDPDEIYRWFMELFVDAYDWVMVPNVFAMSQNADGGLITTKPYFSGSSYVKKMSNHKQADWCATWDALYWRWIIQHADELEKNPRWAMMVAMPRKMDEEKCDNHLKIAAAYLRKLSSEAA